MQHFLLFYDYVPEYLERRGVLRAAHFAHARAANARGDLQLAGACTDGDPIGVLVFKVEDRATVEAFAREDPYVLHGLVTRWHVRAWTTVMGKEALTVVSLPDETTPR